MRTVVGGVSQLYQGDLDLGRRAVDILLAEGVPPWVTVEDFHYGAVAVAQRLEELRPDVLVLLGAEQAGLPPGTVTRTTFSGSRGGEGSQGAVGDAVTGFVDIDLVLQVCSALGALPARTIVIQVEPEQVSPSVDLSPSAERALQAALAMVRRELSRLPLLETADRLAAHLRDDRSLEDAPALRTARRLAAALREVETSGEWGAAFALGEELRLRIAAGETGEGMDHLDWALWWSVIEGLHRLEEEDAREG